MMSEDIGRGAAWMANFPERLSKAVKSAGGNQKIIDKTGIPKRTLANLLSGRNNPSAIDAYALAEACDVSLIWLLTGIGDMVNVPKTAPLAEGQFQQDNVVNIPVLDVKAAAGAGTNADVVKATGSLPFATDFLRKLVPSTSKLSCLRCAGNSMSPTITDGAILIVDEQQNTLPAWKPLPRKSTRQRNKEDGIYVFSQSGDLRLKRLRDVGDDMIAIISDNDDENPIEIHKRGRDGGLVIIGKVVWWDNRL